MSVSENKTKKKYETKNPQEKLKIVADYITFDNYSKAAELNNVSRITATKIIEQFRQKNPDVYLEMVEENKERIKLDGVNYMRQRRTEMQEIMSLILKEMISGQKIKMANIQQLGTTFGILMDKMVASDNAETQTNAGSFDRLVDAIHGLKGRVSQSANTDDSEEKS